MRTAIAGVGVTKHCAYAVDKTWKEMLCDAVFEALDDSGLDPGDIDGGVVAYIGEASIETSNIGPLVADAVGMAPGGVTGISAACAGGGVALYHAHALVASGQCQVALAAGFEKGSDLYEYVETICPSSESEYDYALGLTHLDWLALMSKRYMHKYEPDLGALERWVEDRHRYARQHRKSFYYGQPMLGREDFKSNLMFLASARADGAAAVLVTTPEIARRHRERPVCIDAVAYASGSAYLPHKFQYGCTELDIADSEITRAACKRAFAHAGLNSATEADLLQISDGAPGVAFMELEALGLYQPGTAWRGVLNGVHSPGGQYPTNTHGGSIAFGHASGAAALVNVVESVTQMRGGAEERQVQKPLHLAVCQASGGSNSNNTVTVLRKEPA